MTLLEIIESGTEARFDNRPEWTKPHPVSLTCDQRFAQCEPVWLAINEAVARSRSRRRSGSSPETSTTKGSAGT